MEFDSAGQAGIEGRVGQGGDIRREGRARDPSKAGTWDRGTWPTLGKPHTKHSATEVSGQSVVAEITAARKQA